MSQLKEEFSEGQIKILEKFVTNTSSNTFVLRNLPEVIKGALFSRYSRSSSGLRSLLLKEFILNEESGFSAITSLTKNEEEEEEDPLAAIQKAQEFYDRILDGYGDDSIGELGGAHLAIENLSILGAKALEESRVGGSPLEKSTRYIYFDQKTQGEYLFYQEPILMTSAYRELFIKTCTLLFDTYSRLIPPLMAFMEKKFPKESEISKSAYSSALRAKVLDCLRGLLPASTLTNMGIFGNGRFFERIIQKLQCHSLVEMRDLGKEALAELSKVIPSFVKRADPTSKYFQSFSRFIEQSRGALQKVAEAHRIAPGASSLPGVQLIYHDPDCVAKVAGALLFESSSIGLGDLQKYCQSLSENDLGTILDTACLYRENRRHASPRALEQALFTFDLQADFGTYRDLQRHRMLTQERQLLTCNCSYFIPQEIIGTEMEEPYVHAMEEAKKAYDIIAQELPEEAQYVVPMAYHIRWYFHLNLRSLQWICELRSSPAGHPNYRYIAQEMARQVSDKIPAFERFFKFVDFEGHELGRMTQEQRTAEKKGKSS